MTVTDLQHERRTARRSKIVCGQTRGLRHAYRRPKLSKRRSRLKRVAHSDVCGEREWARRNSQLETAARHHERNRMLCNLPGRLLKGTRRLSHRSLRPPVSLTACTRRRPRPRHVPASASRASARPFILHRRHRRASRASRIVNIVQKCRHAKKGTAFHAAIRSNIQVVISW